MLTENNPGLTEHPGTLQLLRAEIPSATARLLPVPKLPTLKQRYVMHDADRSFSLSVPYRIHTSFPLLTSLTIQL